MMMIATAQVLALYVMGCCIGGIIGCNAQVWENAGTCATNTALGCSSQAVAGCIAPAMEGGGNGWEKYAVCLWEQSKSCQTNGLARCAMAAVVEESGFPGVGSPTSSSSLVLMEARSAVPFRCDETTVKMCVTDVSRVENRQEALQVVAYCYAQHCKGVNP